MKFEHAVLNPSYEQLSGTTNTEVSKAEESNIRLCHMQAFWRAVGGRRKVEVCRNVVHAIPIRQNYTRCRPTFREIRATGAHVARRDRAPCN